MSAKHIHIYHVGTDVSTQRTHNYCLAVNVDFTTSELRDIYCCRMSEGIFCIRNICHHQGTHLNKSAADTDTDFNMIHDFNYTRRYLTTIAACRAWKKSIRMLHDERKVNLRATLVQWTIDNNKYITSWQ